MIEYSFSDNDTAKFRIQWINGYICGDGNSNFWQMVYPHNWM